MADSGRRRAVAADLPAIKAVVDEVCEVRRADRQTTGADDGRVFFVKRVEPPSSMRGGSATNRRQSEGSAVRSAQSSASTVWAQSRGGHDDIVDDAAAAKVSSQLFASASLSCFSGGFRWIWKPADARIVGILRTNSWSYSAISSGSSW
jgi:hypothetical protein